MVAIALLSLIIILMVLLARMDNDRAQYEEDDVPTIQSVADWLSQ